MILFVAANQRRHQVHDYLKLLGLMKGPYALEVSEAVRFESEGEPAAVFETRCLVEAVYVCLLKSVPVTYVLWGLVEVLSDDCSVAEAVE